ncbi:MAG: HD domain-containing protein [Melioribacteraceae bacterium]|nr:HD domain-containing protein [Melioribacteraceae bacterium]
MFDPINIQEKYISEREKIFSNEELISEPLNFCVSYSLLIEEYIFNILKNRDKNFAVASVGSFSRRELSPYSDIDVMFIVPLIRDYEEDIRAAVTLLWDCGFEVSHTVREYSDIERFIDEDLHTFTQFFETRFICGNEKIYNEWNKKVLSSLNEENRKRLVFQYFDDTKKRHHKFGDSSKVLEPNVKNTAGGLRDLQVIEWVYALKNNLILTNQSEVTQTEAYLKLLLVQKVIVSRAVARLLEAYKFIINVRNHLHLISGAKNDRLEFSAQEKIAKIMGYAEPGSRNFMRRYFECSNTIKRFALTSTKKTEEELLNPFSEILTVQLDDDFILRGNTVSYTSSEEISLPTIMRAFYYRGFYTARLDDSLRSSIIEAVIDLSESSIFEPNSSAFFREILKLPKNVGKTLYAMNELGVLGAFLPEFKDLVGFFQPGVYHCYTADEHTLIALNNLENLENETSSLAKLFIGNKRRDILFLAVLFHDIAKPISVSGHEIIGTEIACSIMERLGYNFESIQMVQFLVQHHLTMEQVAFRRNLNDAVTLDSFAKKIPSIQALENLYLLTYADLSAVSPVVWTQWKSDLLNELFIKTKKMFEERISGEVLLTHTANAYLSESENDFAFREHIESIDDLAYLQHFSQDEINQHIDEIEKGSSVSVFFKEDYSFTYITVIAFDSDSLLSRICGALSINDLNIYDAKIFTRKDGVVIDSFSVTDFRTHNVIETSRYQKITINLQLAINNELQITKEFNKIKSKWWRLENKFFKRKGKIKISFEKHEKYTIIDIFSPDRLGLLYHITKKMNELGLSIYFAKISTKADDVVDSFYILDRNNNKISASEYELITVELTDTIMEML